MSHAEPCILVIDDDPSIRDLYAALFRDERYHVESAVDGRDGLAHLGCAPDLIVLDLAMPLMCGHEFLHQLRGIPGHRETPVLVVSAASGANAFSGPESRMDKPFDTEELLARVAFMLRSSTGTRPN